MHKHVGTCMCEHAHDCVGVCTNMCMHTKVQMWLHMIPELYACMMVSMSMLVGIYSIFEHVYICEHEHRYKCVETCHHVYEHVGILTCVFGLHIQV